MEYWLNTEIERPTPLRAHKEPRGSAISDPVNPGVADPVHIVVNLMLSSGPGRKRAIFAVVCRSAR